MNNKKLFALIIGFFVSAAVIIFGMAVPLGSYTTTNGCDSIPNPTTRLHLISGQSLDEIKAADKPQTNPYVGCDQNTEYILYLL